MEIEKKVMDFLATILKDSKSFTLEVDEYDINICITKNPVEKLKELKKP